MKAMILAAGAGTRLRPLTDSLPKALVPVGGVPILERVILRLSGAGVREIIVNLHHLGRTIENFLNARNNFGLRVEYSREAELLDTGGGLKKASWFFDDGKPFLLHNADVYSEVDLKALLEAHGQSRALATLSVRERETTRPLFFDEAGRLSARGCENNLVPGARWLGFDGIHAVSPEIFSLLAEEGSFSITKAYRRLAAAGREIRAFRADSYYWADIGSPEKLQSVEKHLGGR